MTGALARTYLGCIAYELGQLCSIHELEELVRNESLLESLSALGLERYARSEASAADLALRAASRTLHRTQIMPREVDVLVYATSRSLGIPNSFVPSAGAKDSHKRPCAQCSPPPGPLPEPRWQLCPRAT